MHPLLKKLEHLTDRIIPYLLILLTIIIVLEFGFKHIAEQYNLHITIADYIIISFFVLDDAIWDIWTIYLDIKIKDLKLQYEEVEEAKYAKFNELIRLIKMEKATETINEMIKLNNRGLIKIAN